MKAETGTTQDNTEDLSAESVAPVTDATDSPNALDATEVANYLKEHPDFFQQNSSLLLQLTIPHESGSAISLLERQVDVFRKRNEELQNQFKDFVSNAQDNDQLFEKTRLVILELVRSTSLQTLCEVINSNLTENFDANVSKLVFAGDNDQPEDSSLNLVSIADAKDALGDLFEKKRTFCSRINDKQLNLFFANTEDDSSSSTNEKIVSAAIVPLHLTEDSVLLQKYGTPLLVIGSTGENHFNSSLDTLFLDFIGEVLTAHLQNLAS